MIAASRLSSLQCSRVTVRAVSVWAPAEITGVVSFIDELFHLHHSPIAMQCSSRRATALSGTRIAAAIEYGIGVSDAAIVAFPADERRSRRRTHAPTEFLRGSPSFGRVSTAGFLRFLVVDRKHQIAAGVLRPTSVHDETNQTAPHRAHEIL